MNGTGAHGRERPLIIGTRGSPLALAQAGLVRDRLMALHDGLSVELRVIRTSGDRFTDRPLAEIGGKGLFTKEIEEAIADGTVDLAVHSMKDVPTWLPEGLGIWCVLPREDPRDVLIAADPGISRIRDLPQGARIGTSSLRRAAQALHQRPDFAIVPFRGNVQTRIDKLAAGTAEATFLASAGLRRLGHDAAGRAPLDPDEMLPAPGQGAIGIECRTDAADLRALLAPLDDDDAAMAVTAERALLAALDGSCRTPIAALAKISDSGGARRRLHLRAAVLAPDGSARFDAEVDGAIDADPGTAEALGAAAGADLRRQAGEAFLAALGTA